MGWLIVGLGGQVMYTMRILVQWLASERAGKSVTPRSFWTLSLGGSALLLAYAIHRRDPVFILGQLFGSVVYVRNLVLIAREELARTMSGVPGDGGSVAGVP
jgi:lipid-A-disaccharide synthase-like uncharacterized protein